MNIRQTRQRETILEILRSTHCHPTADWVYEQARKIIPNISLGTVYRNLNFLAKQNQVLRFEHDHVCRYDGYTENHYHFVCTDCGRVCDINVPIDTTLNRRVARGSGYSVSSHRAMFFGLCSECKRK
ncbi:MAG: transcriptional repressor [Gemmatimonadota bacterium]|nr:MAG: transcriptional repressor [Gemmatimonadota bacterium]